MSISEIFKTKFVPNKKCTFKIYYTKKKSLIFKQIILIEEFPSYFTEHAKIHLKNKK